MIRVSYDHDDLDLPLICEFVVLSYWGKGRRAEDIVRSIEASRIVGLYDGDAQVAFARIMSDGVFSAFLYDVFIVAHRRGEGLANTLIQAVMDHPELTTVTGWMLGTKDAHGLYERFGFEHAEPGRYMTLRRTARPG